MPDRARERSPDGGEVLTFGLLANGTAGRGRLAMFAVGEAQICRRRGAPAAGPLALDFKGFADLRGQFVDGLSTNREINFRHSAEYAKSHRMLDDVSPRGLGRPPI